MFLANLWDFLKNLPQKGVRLNRFEDPQKRNATPFYDFYGYTVQNISYVSRNWNIPLIKGVVNCQNSGDKKAIVPVGTPRPYSIIILNMRFIPKASLRASSQITASSYILERHLWVNNSKPLALAPTWSLACKQTDCITAGMSKLADPKLDWHPVNSKHLYDFIQSWTNVEDVGPTLYKCYTIVLCLLGRWTFSQTLYISPMLGQRHRRWPNYKTALGECLVGVVSIVL